MRTDDSGRRVYLLKEFPDIPAPLLVPRNDRGAGADELMEQVPSVSASPSPTPALALAASTATATASATAPSPAPSPSPAPATAPSPSPSTGTSTSLHQEVTVGPFPSGFKKVLLLVLAAASIGAAFFAASPNPQELKPAAAERSLDALTAVSLDGKKLGSCALSRAQIETQISGYVAYVKVKQWFTNPYKVRSNFVYSLPLSRYGSVDAMTVSAGRQFFRGEIQRNLTADSDCNGFNRQFYRSEIDGRKNYKFEQRILYVEPGRPILVELSYAERLVFKGGRYTFTLPATLTAGSQKTSAPENGDQMAPIVDVDLDVNAGFPVGNIDTGSFPVKVERSSAGGARVVLQSRQKISNDDFTLAYEVKNPQSANCGYLSYTSAHPKDSDPYATFMVLPQADLAKALPRDMIFLVDCSSSQAGAPLERTKETLHYVVDHLAGADTIQIVASGPVSRFLPERPLGAGFVDKIYAHDLIDKLSADGISWDEAALSRAIASKQGELREGLRARMVTFMTNGSIENESNLVQLVKDTRDKLHWFFFCAGRTFDAAFLDNLARIGGSEVEYVDLNTPREEVGRHFNSLLASPLLTDLKVSSEDLQLYDVYPQFGCEVRSDQPLYFTARYKGGSGKVKISGKSYGSDFVQYLELKQPLEATASGIEKEWARQKVNYLLEKNSSGLYYGYLERQVRESICELALSHRILSPYTEFALSEPHPYRAGADYFGAPLKSDSPDWHQSKLGYNLCCSKEQILLGATSGTIAPQMEGSDQAPKSGKFDLSDFAQVAALLNFLAGYVRIAFVLTGAIFIALAFCGKASGRQKQRKRIITGCLLLTVGVLIPCLVEPVAATIGSIAIFH